MRTIIISAALVLSTFAFAAPASAAGCSNSGFGDESCSDLVTCNNNTYVNVHASVDESGWVQGSIQCGGASASCSGSLSCTSAWSLTTYGGNGWCEGAGNGGWWTVLVVSCSGALAESSPLQDPVSAVKSLGSTDLTEELDDLLTPESGSSVWMIGMNGIMVGYSCVAGNGCMPVVPLCDVGLMTWSCVIK